MPGTTSKGVVYPLAGDLVKAPNVPSQLAETMRVLAQTSDVASGASATRALADAVTYADVKDKVTLDQANQRSAQEVEALRAATDSRLSELENAAGFPEPPLGFNDEIVSSLIANGESQTRTQLDQWLSSRAWITPEDFGAMGDGIHDDSDAIEQAISASIQQRREVVLDASKTYTITRTISNTVPVSSVPVGQYGFSLRSSQRGVPAKVRMSDSVPANAHLRMMRFQGETVAEIELNRSTAMQTRRWTAAAGGIFQQGMLMGVESSKSWYYDPRPESTDARKSEMHRIASVEGNDVYSEAPAFDGYIILEESVKLHAILPIAVNISDILLERALPPEGEASDGYRQVLLEVHNASNSRLERVDTHGGTAAGIKLLASYNSHIIEGNSFGSNNYFEGYGVQVGGNTFCSVDGRYVSGARRGIDVSQGGRFTSKHTLVKNCKIVGGGKNNRGGWFGWTPEGLLGTSQTGMGSHGPADFTTYENNVILDTHSAFTVRGGNETIRGNRIYGRQLLAAIGLAAGGGVTIIDDNQLISGWSGTQKDTTVLDGMSNINGRRPNRFILIYTDYDSTRAELYVRNNYAEVQEHFIQLGSNNVSAVPLRGVIFGNRINFSPVSGASEKIVLYNPEPGSLRQTDNRWTVALNDPVSYGGSGPVLLTKGINLNHSKVMEFSTSGPTS